MRRVAFLSYLLLPDVLASGWFGAPAEFSLADRLPVLLIAGVILAYAWSLGWLLMALVGADRGLTRLENYVFSTAIGLNAASTYVLAAGLLGGLHNPLVFSVPAAITLAVAGRLRWRRVLAQWPEVRRNGKEKQTSTGKKDDRWLSPRWIWLAAPFVLVILLGGMLPPVDFDVREYHLQVPKEWYQQGQIGFLPHNVYGNMAMGAQMHSLLAMAIAEAIGGDWWLGALAGKTVIAAMAPLTALALFAAGRRFFSVSAGVVAAVVYISIPWIVSVSTAGLVEGASAYYLLLAVYAVLLYGREREKTSSENSPARKGGVAAADSRAAEPRPSGRGYCHLLLAGYLAGGAVSCKYPAVLFVVLPLALWVFFLREAVGWVERSEAHQKSIAAMKTNGGPRSARPTLQVCQPVGIFLLAASLGCGLWFGKNWVLTGNPTYPLLYEFFGGKTWTPEKNRQWNNVHRPKDFHPTTLAKDLARVGLTSEWLSPLLVPLAVLALLDRKRRRLVIGLSAYFGCVIAAWWLLTHRIDRFWIPALPLIALLGGAGACWSRQPWWRRLLIAMLLAGLGANLVVAASRYRAYFYNPFFVRLERLRRDIGQDDRPGRVDPWHRYLNTNVGKGRVLMVGDAQVFDLEVPVLYNTCFDDCLFEQLVKDRNTEGIRSAEEIRRALAEENISYVYVHWGEIWRYRSPGNYGFTDFVQQAVFEDLVEQRVLEPLPDIEGHPGRGYRVRAD
jgi:4-amino-4-deoxy-L-arabinose transferase-like glycosyltransferase